MKHWWTIAAMVFAGSTVSAGPAYSCGALPPAIQADPFLESVVAAVLAASPTFSLQCQRIADTRFLTVSIRPLPRREDACCRARTTIRRYPSGAMIAWVEIPALRTRLEHAELLGHEFEHILEQIDQVDLDAQTGRGGASRLGDGSYETARARRAGERVALEFELTETTFEAKRPQRSPSAPVRSW
jgi:hypothetical protein